MKAGGMRNVILLHEGEAGGRFSLEVEGLLVHARCDWPFERGTDDVIAISNEFGVDMFNEALASVRESGRGQVRGVDGGFLAFRAMGNDMLEIDLANRHEGFLAKSLSFRVSVTPAELIVRS